MDLAFGSWLKRRRRALDLTQEDLAKRAFCSVNSVRKIESGDLVPSKALALEIARVLVLPPDTHAEFVRFARTPGATAPEQAFALGPASPAPSPSTQLKFQPPAPLTALIGREHDTSIVIRMLRLPAARLVTLTGPPGTGKTRLSLEVAAELQSEFEHGAAFVALASLAEAALVEGAIAEQLGVREIGQTQLSAALRAFLRDKQLLLILDNFEHVLDAAPLLNELLSAASRVKVLATSREPLHVYGERERQLAPLGLPALAPLPAWRELENYPAVQLFVERAQAVRPGFELNAVNAETVARICVRLDGLPLAIEMAAARVKWDPPAVLLEQLERRLTSLRSEMRGRDPRQQTLRAALDWSYERLEENERRALRSLGVFRGGFTIEAANAVCESPVGTVLENLIEKSLVKKESTAEDGARYTLLETIREYALEQLTATGELEQARTRHADFFRRAVHTIWEAREFGTHGGWAVFDTRDEDNFRAALTWLEQSDPISGVELTTDLHAFWTDSGLAREGHAWLARLLPSSVDAPIYPRGLNSNAALAVTLGDLEEGWHVAERARALSEAQQQPVPLGDSLQILGRISLYRGEFARAEQFLLTARALFQELGLRSHEAYALNNLGLIAKDRGELEQAQAYHQAALQLRRALGLQSAIGQSLLNLAIVAYWSGDYARAIEVGAECYAVYRADGDKVGMGYILETVGMAHFKLKHFAQAAQTLQESTQYLQASGDKRGTAMVLNALGDVARAESNFDHARECYAQGLQLCLQTGEKRRTAFLLEALAGLLAESKKELRATQLLGAADGLRQAIGIPVYAAERADYDAVVNQIRATLSHAEFENAWQQGQALTFEEAIGKGLEIES